MIATSIMVVIASFIFAIFLFFADQVIVKLYEGIFKVLGS